MDANIIQGPNGQQRPAIRTKVKLTGMRIEIEMTDLYGQKDYIHATHLANETLSIRPRIWRPCHRRRSPTSPRRSAGDSSR